MESKKTATSAESREGYSKGLLGVTLRGLTKCTCSNYLHYKHFLMSYHEVRLCVGSCVKFQDYGLIHFIHIYEEDINTLIFMKSTLK